MGSGRGPPGCIARSRTLTARAVVRLRALVPLGPLATRALITLRAFAALVDYVLEERTAEFVHDLRAWDEAREVGNIDRAVVDCIAPSWPAR